MNKVAHDFQGIRNGSIIDSGGIRLKLPVTLETCVFEEVLEKVSNDILSLSIYYCKCNLQNKYQARTNGSNKDSGGL